jgi:hypothetical protein
MWLFPVLLPDAVAADGAKIRSTGARNDSQFGVQNPLQAIFLSSRDCNNTKNIVLIAAKQMQITFHASVNFSIFSCRKENIMSMFCTDIYEI